jgi:glycosyltransferase involved in cell wall biosynthesis
MTSDLDPRRMLAAQAERLRVVAELLGVDAPGSAGPREEPRPPAAPGAATLALLDPLVARVHDDDDPASLWLLLTALAGVLPGVDDIEWALEQRAIRSPAAFADRIIAASSRPAAWGGERDLPLRVVTGVPLVDVSSCARFDRHTGIQRVERETLPRWTRDHALELAAWTDLSGGYRSLSPKERSRVLDWADRAGRAELPDGPVDGQRLLVPWRTVVVLPEVADARQASRLRALALYSGNRVTAVGYDMIPLTSPDMLPRDVGTDFLDFLGVVRALDVVAGISRSATEEFQGFVDATRHLDAVAPELVTCELPTDVPPAERRAAPVATGTPAVLCVGSHEPRKNHGAVLHAAERLWREGHRFSLQFLGGGGWGTDFEGHAAELVRAGRDLRILKGVSDDALWAAYRDARFTVFPSLHEGFGLPVAESLAFGTPVITTDYGSTREIAVRGGCLAVDPRDDDAVFAAMRSLLTDAELLDRLRAQARAVELRSWDDYASELWSVLVETR